MNSLFSEPRPLYDAMQQALIALQNNERASIVLATADDPFNKSPQPYLLRDEIRGEIAERLFGEYTFYEFNAATAAEDSIPRHCRTLRERPACLFAYGLETVKANDPQRYHTMLLFLNQHREDIRYTNTALVLLLSPDIQKDVQEYAPDFADWRTASVLFKVPPGEDVPSTRVGAMPVMEADELRKQLARFRSALQTPNVEPSLELEFLQQQAEILERLGRIKEKDAALGKVKVLISQLSSVTEVEKIYLDNLLKQCANLNPRGIPQTVRAVTLPLDEVYVSLTAERTMRRISLDVTHKAPYSLFVAHEERDREAIAGLHALFDDEGEQASLPAQPEFHIRLPDNAAQFDLTNLFSTFTEKADLPKIIRESDKAVILGDPGAGKTTLMKFLAARFADAYRRRETVVRDREGNDYGEPRLPILVRVAAYADACRKKPNLTLQEFLSQAFDDGPLTRKELKRLFTEAIAKGRAIILLDGLDEVASAGARSGISRQIDLFAQLLDFRNRLIVTSRVAGYSEAKLTAIPNIYTLRDMEREQIGLFLLRWCTAVERFHTPDASKEDIDKKGQEESDLILREIDENEGVQRLAKNPLLLTILSLIHRNGSRLPQRRIELYEIATKTLLREWRLMQAGGEAVTVDEYEALELLGPLAYWMHENEPTGLISGEDATKKLRNIYAETRGLTAGNEAIQAGVEEFLRRVREHTGLFVEKAPGKYGFMHLTFEEYFAAREIISDFMQASERIYFHRHKARWEEPIRLAIAYKSPKDAAYLIRTAILAQGKAAESFGYEPSKYEEFLHRDLLLAVRCLGDCAGIEATLAREVTERLLSLLFEPNAEKVYYPLQNNIHNLLPSLAGSEVGVEISRQLFAALKSENSEVRADAVRAIGYLRQVTPEEMNTLIEALHDEAQRVRYHAATTLRSIGQATPQIIEAFQAALQDKDIQVQKNVWWILLELGHLPDTPYLLHEASIDNRPTQGLLDSQARYALFRGDISQAKAVLREALSNPSDEVKNYAINILSQQKRLLSVAGDVIPEYYEGFSSDIKRKIIESFYSYEKDSGETAALMVRALQDKDSGVRQSAAYALNSENVNLPSVIATLRNAMHDDSPEVRAAAIRSFGNAKQPTPEVLGDLRNALQDKAPHVRQNAMYALTQLGDRSDELLHAAEAAICAKHNGLRDAAWLALSNYIQPDAVTSFEEDPFAD